MERANAAEESVRRRPAAFTLVEIMVVIGLLTVIVLGLLAMFSQVQRAFKAGMAQTDVLESGRMAMEMMTRELQETTPSYRYATNFQVNYPMNLTPPYVPVPQELPATSPTLWRSNVLQDLFFLTRQNQRWVGIGYIVTTPVEGVGSLYRMETNAPLSRDPNDLLVGFQNAALNRFSRIVDGVVQFRVRTYTTNGTWIVGDIPNTSGATNIFSSDSPPVAAPILAPGETGYYAFRSNAVPAYVELELGILEQQTWDRYKSIPVIVANPTPRMEFLRKQANHVHLFRQRIALRNVDATAY